MSATSLALWVVFAVGGAAAAPADGAAEAALRALSAKVPAFQVIDLPTSSGTVVLSSDQSLTVRQLRGVDLDEEPPRLGKPAEPYDRRMTDGHPPGEAPYVARGIKPFRFKHFNCEFNYGGWHNYAMADYAAAHGFNIIYPYGSKTDQRAHLPAGTEWLTWGDEGHRHPVRSGVIRSPLDFTPGSSGCSRSRWGSGSGARSVRST